MRVRQLELSRVFEPALAHLTELCSGQQFDPEAPFRLAEFVATLAWYNQTHRLVGPRQPEEIARQLVLDSLGLAPYVREPLLDVGTGAGLPGLVLRLVFPSLEVTLLEPRKKAVSFLAWICARFQLEDIMIYRERAERMTMDRLLDARPAACVSAKGLGTLERLVPLIQHLVRPGALVLVPSSRSTTSFEGSWILKHPLLPERYIHAVEIGIGESSQRLSKNSAPASHLESDSTHDRLDRD